VNGQRNCDRRGHDRSDNPGIGEKTQSSPLIISPGDPLHLYAADILVLGQIIDLDPSHENSSFQVPFLPGARPGKSNEIPNILVTFKMFGIML
jgi:curli biogenesis system outer membrane secretion channel CsgG